MTIEYSRRLISSYREKDVKLARSIMRNIQENTQKTPLGKQKGHDNVKSIRCMIERK